jgi:predicted nuclease of predicted toxin-antitoxin system
MKGFLLDEHLPSKIQFSPSFPTIHVSALGASLTDTQIWQYAKHNDLTIITKDADFSNRLMMDLSPPKVVHLRFGNMRKRVFHVFLARVWPKIETLLMDCKMINVYLDRVEVIK